MYTSENEDPLNKRVFADKTKDNRPPRLFRDPPPHEENRIEIEELPPLIVAIIMALEDEILDLIEDTMNSIVNSGYGRVEEARSYLFWRSFERHKRFLEKE